MAFWTNRESPLIPQQKNKFYVVIGADAQRHAFWVNKTNLPGYSYPVDKTQYGTGQIHVANGTPKWNEIQMELYDYRAAQTDSSNSFTNGGYTEGQKWFLKTVYSLKSQLFSDKAGTRKALAGAFAGKVNKYNNAQGMIATIDIYKFNFNAINRPGNQENHKKTLTDVWTLHGPILKDINWGDLDYNSDDINKIQVTFAYDYATLEQKFLIPAKVTQ